MFLFVRYEIILKKKMMYIYSLKNPEIHTQLYRKDYIFIIIEKILWTLIINMVQITKY